MESLDDFRTRVLRWCKVPNGPGKPFDDDDIDAAIESALSNYSTLAGITKTVQLASPGPEHDLSAVAGWSHGWQVSSVKRFTASGGFHIVDNDYWNTHEKDGKQYLFTAVSSPWVEFVCPAVIAINKSGSTLPSKDLNLVAKLAAAGVLRQYAAKNVDTQSSNIIGDSVSYLNLSRTMNDMADKYEEDFAKWASARYAGNASGPVEWDIRSSSGRMLFHGGSRW